MDVPGWPMANVHTETAKILLSHSTYPPPLSVSLDGWGGGVVVCCFVGAINVLMDVRRELPGHKTHSGQVGDDEEGGHTNCP